MAFKLANITRPIWNTFASAFSKVYWPDSYDGASNRFNYQPIEDINKRFFGDSKLAHEENNSSIKHYRRHFLILLTTFFGLPNRFELDESITLAKIGKNLQGLQEGKNDQRTEFNNNILVRIYSVVKSILFAAFITAQNTLKLATEFLPALIAEIFFAIARPIFRLCKQTLTAKWTLSNLLMVTCLLAPLFISTLIFTVAKTIQLAGRTITSPINSVRSAWFSSHTINHFLADRVSDHPAMKLLGYAAGLILSLMSIAATTSVYMILFPLLVNMTPMLHIHIHYVGSNFLWPLLMKMGIFMEPALETVAAIIGICTGLAVTTFGPIIQQVVDAFRYQWRVSDNAVICFDRFTFDTSSEEEPTTALHEKFHEEPDANIYPEFSFPESPLSPRTQASPGTSSNTGFFKHTNEPTLHLDLDKELDSHAYSPRGRTTNL